MASFCPQDFDNRVVIVATGGVNGHACRLVDNNDVVVFVDHSNGLRRDGGLMSMKRVADDVAIIQRRIGR